MKIITFTLILLLVAGCSHDRANMKVSFHEGVPEADYSFTYRHRENLQFSFLREDGRTLKGQLSYEKTTNEVIVTLEKPVRVYKVKHDENYVKIEKGLYIKWGYLK